MAGETQTSPEQNPSRPVERAAVAVDQTKAPTPAAGAEGHDVQTFNETVDKKAAAYEQKIEALQNRFRSSGSVGEAGAEQLTAKQINRLREAAQDAKNRYAQQIAELMDSAPAARAELAKQVLAETDKQLENIYVPYEQIIAHVRGLGQLNDADLVKLEAMMEAMTKLRANPELEKLCLKVLRHEQLDKKEMQLLVDQAQPLSLSGSVDQKNLGHIFESSQVGVVIGLLSPAQKMEFMETCLQSKPVNQSVEILNSLLESGQINNLQLQALIGSGKLPAEAAALLQAQLTNGDLAKKQEDYQKQLAAVVQTQQGRTAENPVLKIAGTPGLMMLTALWGLATALVNAKAGSFGPYFWMGTAAATAGTLGVVKVVSPDTYNDIKTTAVSAFDGPKQKAEKQTIAQNELETTLKNEIGRNPFLLDFLLTPDEFPGGVKKTGLDLVQSLAYEQKSQGKDVAMDYNLLVAKAGPHQLELLQKAYASGGSKDINFKQSLQGVMIVLTELKIDEAPKLQAYSDKFHQEQGLTSAKA